MTDTRAVRQSSRSTQRLSTGRQADFAGYRDAKGAQQEVCRMMYDHRADFEALSREVRCQDQ